jgi:hypothetical protein
LTILKEKLDKNEYIMTETPYQVTLAHILRTGLPIQAQKGPSYVHHHHHHPQQKNKQNCFHPHPLLNGSHFLEVLQHVHVKIGYLCLVVSPEYLEYVLLPLLLHRPPLFPPHPRPRPRPRQFQIHHQTRHAVLLQQLHV